MSNIIKSNNDLYNFSDDIKHIEKKGITIFHIKNIMKRMIPKNYIKQVISNKKQENGDVAFIPTTKTIRIDMNKLETHINEGIKMLTSDYNLKNENILKSYLLFLTISHEIEHTYQFLMGEKIIDAPNETLAQAYKDIYDIALQNKFSIAKMLYFENQKKLLLERNAQVESLDLVLKCAQYNDRLDIYEAFKEINNRWALIGYNGKYNGCIEDTYFSLSLFNKYKNLNFNLNISEEDKIRFGFPISEETRQILLKK